MEQKNLLLNGFTSIMKKHEEIKQAFDILKIAIQKAEQEFDVKYQKIISGVEILQNQDAAKLAGIANGFLELSKTFNEIEMK